MSKLKKWVIEQFPSNEDTKYPDENGDWYQVLAVDTILAAKDEEIERLKKELNRFKRFASCQKPEDLGKRIHDYNGMIEGQGNEIIKLRTELAEERRLNAEHEAHAVNTMNRHGVKEFRLDTNGWQDILRKKEEAK